MELIAIYQYDQGENTILNFQQFKDWIFKGLERLSEGNFTGAQHRRFSEWERQIWNMKELGELRDWYLDSYKEQEDDLIFETFDANVSEILSPRKDESFDKQEIYEILKKYGSDNNNKIDLRAMDFTGLTFFAYELKADQIKNTDQEAYNIDNSHQKARNEINNSYQKSEERISNWSQRAVLEIVNNYQEAMRIFDGKELSPEYKKQLKLAKKG